MGVKDFFNKIFKRPTIQQTFITKAPQEVIKELQKEFYTKQVLRENAQLQTEGLKKDAIIKKYQEQDKAVKEQEEIEKDILKTKELEKRLEKQRSVIFKIISEERAPTLYTKTNKPWGKFIGFWCKETEDGITLWYPLIKSGRDLQRINCHAINPMEFFHSLVNLPSQLKGGKIDMDIDFSNGKPVIVKDKDVIQRLIEEKYGKDVKVVHMDEYERKEFADKLRDMADYIKQLHNKIKEYEDKELDYEHNLNELDLVSKSLEKDRDLANARVANIMDKQHAMAVSTARANSSVQEAVIGQMLTEKGFKQVFDAYDKMVEKLSSKLSSEEKEAIRDEMKAILLEGISIRKSAEVSPQVTLIPQKTIVQEEKKKEQAMQ
jgi:hypothetical protein